MKTTTHYLYGFIIVSLLLLVIYLSVSKPKLEEDKNTIETTPPLQITPYLETPTEIDLNEESTEMTINRFYRDTLYVFYALVLYNLLNGVYRLKGYESNSFNVNCSIVSLLVYYCIISMIQRSLQVYEYIILSLYLASIPITLLFYFLLPFKECSLTEN